MTIVLNSKFATAEDTAKALGVSKTRLKWLKRLMSSEAVFSGKTGGRKFSHKNGTKVTASAKKAKNAGSKAKKIAR